MRTIKFMGVNLKNDYHDFEMSEPFQVGSILSQRGWDILLQYTGLNDKNGVEIYEGDIIRYGYKDELFPIEFKYGGWFIDWDGGYYIGNEINPSKEAEVVGNIYENAELFANKVEK